MKDLSKLTVTKKNTQADVLSAKVDSSNKKKKRIIIVAIVCLLAVAVGSKIANKHLKKKKYEQAKQEQILASTNTDDKTNKDIIKEAKASQKDSDMSTVVHTKKMVFTFYNKLKKESVVIDVEPQKAKTQYKYTYIYQVTSFRNMNESSYYVKKMKSVGLVPEFKKVGSWIRMSIGPYNSKRDIAPDVIKLQKIGLNGGYTREISRTKIIPKPVIKEEKKITSKKQ